MKTLVTLALALCAGLAQAGVENMVAQCEAVMRCDVCRVEKDTDRTGETKRINFVDQRGRLQERHVAWADYDYIRNAGDAKKGGRYLMCLRVEEAMKQPDSPRGSVAQALFNANWQRREYCAVPR